LSEEELSTYSDEARWMDSKNIPKVLKGEKQEDLNLLNVENKYAVRKVCNETHESPISIMDWLSLSGDGV
jgi:hypothetical protein